MSAPLDLVLVQPGNRAQVYQQLGSRLAAIEPSEVIRGCQVGLRAGDTDA